MDIHKAILKVAPKRGFVPPNMKFLGPGNPVYSQVSWDKDGTITKIFQQPTGPTDAVAMQHDVDYSICGDDLKCKHEADRKMVESLDKIPKDQRQWGHFMARNIINMKQKVGVGMEEAKELHKPIKNKFTKRRVFVSSIDETWCADLVEMQSLSKWNAGNKYLLMVLDIFSKYGWIIPVPNKSGPTITNAFKKILKGGRKPQTLWVDKGKEFYNKEFKHLMAINNILMYSTENEEKASVCERWNRTIKTNLWRYFTAQNHYKYLEILPIILKEYLTTKHRSIKMTPVEASLKKNEKKVYSNLFGDVETNQGRPKFKEGDRVRIRVSKKLFEKGYTPNWTKEIFIITLLQKTTPYTYRIEDLGGEDIIGSFYEPELQKTHMPDYQSHSAI